MDYVFSTEDHPAATRYAAWRDAICDVYVHVDVAATDPDCYRGFIREAKFGDVVLTDILLSEQRIRRNRRHLSQLDKDCYYLQLPHHGALEVRQNGTALTSNAARGAIFCATEEYDLTCRGEVRSFYLELPRAAFAARFPQGKVPLVAGLTTTRGLGRIATEFCASLATESPNVGASRREDVGGSLMDLLALALQASDDDQPQTEGSVRAARLRSVQQWIEAHLSDPDLTLDRIAAANGLSLRSLHLVFKGGEMSVSEWIWNRRLQLAHDRLSRGDGRSITLVAYELGFSSSAHFSTLFRRRFGLSPRDVARAGG